MTSRNQREGRFVGRSCGKAVRWRKGLRRRVRGAKARAVMARRTYAAYGLFVLAECVDASVM